MEAFYANNTMELGKKMSGILYGIGVGPGDPELITLKSLRLIESAEIIAYPKLEGSESFARKIVECFIEPTKTEIAIEIPMSEKRLPRKRIYLVLVVALVQDQFWFERLPQRAIL